MEYQQFVEDVKDCISVKIEKDYEVKVNRVMKNNSVELDGIVFFKSGDTISPNIYLNQYFVRYQEGEPIETIADDIIGTYETSMKEQGEEYSDLTFTFEQFKDRIIYRVVNYNQNKVLLENVPHVRFLDLAITFHCLVKQDESGIGTIRLTNEHKQLWNLSVKQLMQLASENTERLFPIKINTMEEVLAELFRQDWNTSEEKDIEQIALQIDRDEQMLREVQQESELADAYVEEDNEELTEEMLDTMLNDLMRQQKTPKMYIMTNSVGINGATAMIYRDAIRNFANMLESDFYILPSSIHEVILVPYEDSISREELKDMVNEVNCTQVPIEEVLSNRVYIYRRKTNMIEV